MTPKYSVWNNRPTEIYRYSLIGDLIQFNYKGLNPYTLKKNLKIGVDYSLTNRISLKTGLSRYKRKVFSTEESRIRNFLLTLVAYESSNKIEPTKDQNLEIYCHNGLHSDLVLRTDDKYAVILYKNKLIFSNTETRANQNELFSYIGIKFETILCNQPSPVDGSHTKLLLKGKYGRWNFKSVVEIDSYRKSEGAKSIEQMSELERYKNYCEVKLCFTPKATPSILKSLKTNREFLVFLKYNVNYFFSKIKKWLFQSYFGRQDVLVVGIRNKDFVLICNQDLNIIDDVIPFVKDEYPKLYETFTNSIDSLDSIYQNIYDQVKSMQEDENDVFLLNCNTLNIQPVNKNEPNGQTFENIMIPEYLDWVNNKRDTLPEGKWIDEDSYTSDDIASKLAKLNISNA